ncbi:MAG TPA: glycosyltransferase family A protein [Thermoleophilaceae bacterium]
MAAEPVVSVVVPARDSAATIARTLEALAAQRVDVPYEVIVVDDGSSDRTAELARAAGVRVIESEGSGAAAARNRGVADARGSVIAFTDSDCFPAPGWLAAGLEAIERGAEFVQGRVEPDPEVAPGPFDRTLWVEGERGFYESANLLIRRELFERLGGFEDWMPIGGRPFAEDVWLGWRVVRSGARITFAPDALVYHAVFPRGPLDFIAERRRLGNFAAVARRIPEFRTRPMFGYVFMSRRSAALDAALAGATLGALRRSPLPLVAALPYGAMVASSARPYRRRAPLVAAVGIAADLVGAASLLLGSVRSRSVVL